MRSRLHSGRRPSYADRVRRGQLHRFRQQKFRPPFEENLMGGLTKTVLALAVLAAAGVAAGRYYPPLRLFAFKAAGRSPVCPLDHALKANENEKLQLQYKDRI